MVDHSFKVERLDEKAIYLEIVVELFLILRDNRCDLAPGWAAVGAAGVATSHQPRSIPSSGW